MKNFLISLVGIVVVGYLFSLIANFFDIKSTYYIPFTAWIISLLIFNMFLEQNHENIFMKEMTN